MKCGECGKPIKPVVAVDIDGTVSEYHTALTKFIGAYWGFYATDIAAMMDDENGLASWDGNGDFEEWLDLSREEYREAKLAYRQGGFKRWSPCFLGAREMVNGFHKLGCDVWFTTTRPWNRLDNVDPDTKEWLARNHFEYEGLLFDEDKYGKLVDIVGADRIVGVIEDLPENIDRADELGLPTFQVQRNHNQHPKQQRQPRGTLETALQWVRINVGERNDKQGRNQQQLPGFNQREISLPGAGASPEGSDHPGV